MGEILYVNFAFFFLFLILQEDVSLLTLRTAPSI